MSQRQQLERIYEIDRRIRAGEFPNALSLAKILEVGKRVIYNDRTFMVDRLGAPLAYDHEHGGWFYTNSAWALPNVMVTEGELLAFLVSVEIASRYIGTALEPALRSAVDKISKGIKAPVSVSLESMRSVYTFASPALTNANETILLELSQAIQNDKKVWMGYFTASRGDHTERTIAPYHLYNIHGDWYLIAFDDLRGEIRNFLVSRIESLKILPETFQRDLSFSIENWMGQAFQTERGDLPVEVKIWFDAFQARYIRERRWHATQTIENLPDKSLILTYRTSGLEEVKRWVLQYGAHAKVLVPDVLRQAVKEEVERLNNRYSEE